MYSVNASDVITCVHEADLILARERYTLLNLSRCTARNVRLQSWRTLLSVDVMAPNGTAWNWPPLYDQDHTSWLSCARLASIVSQVVVSGKRLVV
jgi:hypothetical protein